MQAQRLDHAGALFLELPGHGFEVVRREELTVFLELRDLIVAAVDLGFRDLGNGGVLLEHGALDFLAAVVLIQPDHVIGQRVHGVDRAGAHVQHDVEAE